MEKQFINKDPIPKAYKIGRDVNNIASTLSELVTKYYQTSEKSDPKSKGEKHRSESQIPQTVEEIVKKHEISYCAFHGMRRAFRPSNTYYVSLLDKTKIETQIADGRRQHPHSECRFIKFTFDNGNNARFTTEFKQGFEFCSGVSCYHELLLETLFRRYQDIYFVKGKNKLPRTDSSSHCLPLEAEGKQYQGKYIVAMLQCEVKNPLGTTDDEKFDYFDVVHDPGPNCK